MTRSRKGAELLTAYESGGYPHFKNRIINGAMMIDQRNGGASVTVNSDSDFYSVDRFAYRGEISDGVFTAQQTTTAPAGFKNSVKITVTTADTSLGSTQSYLMRQRIEGFNCADLAWGTASASAVTLSFWVRSSLTGTFGGAIINSAFNRSYPFSYTISAADTWEYKTVTIPGDTTGTWLTDNGTGMVLSFSFGAGSGRTGTAGAWVGANTQGVTGQVSLIGTNGATFYITGVQLEKGSTATSFDYRPYGTELALCQRYYCQSTNQVAASGLYSSGYSNYAPGWNYAGGAWVGPYSKFPVSMRAIPTVSLYTTSANPSSSAGNINHYQGTWAVAPANVNPATTESMLSITAATATGSTGSCLIMYNYAASAEL